MTTMFPKERIVSKEKKISDPEIARSMTYPQVKDGEDSTESECVKFDAFFLRDLDGDGYAEKIRGTCREIGKEDTLYIELRVNESGRFENGLITINGDNFYLQTTLPKDDELEENVIGNNIKQIKLNTIQNGTQKLLTGIVKSGDYSYSSRKASAIGSDTSNYSKINNITLTGTHIADDGTVTELKGETAKVVNFQVDWHGKTNTQIMDKYKTYSTLQNAVNEENNELKLSFDIKTEETLQQLILSKSYIEGTMPDLNGYNPIKVEITGTDVNFTYNETTRKFTAYREATRDENGKTTKSVSRTNTYRVNLTYPLDAYRSLGLDEIEIRIPLEAYYEGYNNEDEEFKNPYKSNIAKDLVIAKFKYYTPGGRTGGFDIQVGKYVSDPYYRYIVSKNKPLRIYNGLSEAEIDDKYIVRWYCDVGTYNEYTGITMKETATGKNKNSDSFIKVNGKEDSMENLTSNVGIYFSDPTRLLGEDGWIRVYDDVTNDLLVTFTKENWRQYSESKPYVYENPVKHIRVQTSATKKDSSISVYNIKELDDDYITSNYERENFDELVYIKSNLVGGLGQAESAVLNARALYEEPMSVAKVSISPNLMSTQETKENVQIKIITQANSSCNEEKWLNGSFLLKLPEEIINIELESKPEINNSKVKILSYEIYEEEGSKFIKILTENVELESYTITLNTKITPDPRSSTVSKNIELYATNKQCENYYYKAQDIYDINNNLNTSEDINKATTSINLVAPNSLLTNQLIKDYDDKGSWVIGPQVGIVENNQGKATIELEIKNNYANAISEISILGKIPTEGNTYVINGKNLESEYSTTMISEGIKIPDELKPYAKVYYSEEVNPDKELNKAENGWKENSINWEKVKSYLIVLDKYVMKKDQKHVFSYEVEISKGAKYGQIAYSHHGVYFSLNTDQGRYKTSIEPNRVGLMLVKRFDLGITKYQKDKDKKVSGATYSIIAEGDETGNTKVTSQEGKINIDKLYVGKTYIIKEIKTPDQYELNAEEIKFTTEIKEDGTIEATLISGHLREGTNILATQTEQGYKVDLQVEDEVRANLKITKVEKGTTNGLRGVKYRLTGKGFENKKILTTNNYGEIYVTGLYLNQEYILEEIMAEGYYIANPIKFKITNNGTYEVERIEGEISENTQEEVDDIPVICLKLEDEKIPRYNLQINKVVREETTPVEGAVFRLYKNGKNKGTYTSDEQGIITIEDLYQYEAERDIDQTYLLREIHAPEGYIAVKDITFRVEKNAENQLIMELIDGKIKDQSSTEDTVIITVEDIPTFKLIKTDGETAERLPNTKFAIYNVEGKEDEVALDSKGSILGTKEIINGKEYYTLTTDEKGEITANLGEGVYKAVEIQANDEKYDITNNVYYFGIGMPGNITKGIKKIDSTMIGYSEMGGNSIYQIIATGDNEYVLVGESYYEEGVIIKYTDNEEKQMKFNENASCVNSIKQTTDGGYLVGGHFYFDIDFGNNVILQNNGSGCSGMVIKYDANWEVVWAKAIGKNIKSVDEIREGEYIVVEDYETIVKYNETGEIIWTNEDTVWNGSGSNRIHVVTATSDGGFIVGGYFESDSVDLGNNIILLNEYYNPNGGYGSGMIIKYDKNNKAEWAKVVEAAGSEAVGVGGINSIIETKDGGYLAVGSIDGKMDIGNGTILEPTTSADGMLLKYNANGEIEWGKTIAINNEFGITDVIETSNGYLIVAKIKSSNGLLDLENDLESLYVGNKHGILIMYDFNGIPKYMTNSEEISTIDKINDDEILAVNFQNEIERYNVNEVVEKLETKSKKEISNNNTHIILSTASISDGGYIVGGAFEGILDLGNNVILNNNTSNSLGMIIKYDKNGKVEWAKQSSESIEFLEESSDNGIIISGREQIEKYTLDGDLEWSKKIEIKESFEIVRYGNVYINGMTTTDNGNIVLAYSCSGYDSVNRHNDYHLIETYDLSGNCLDFNIIELGGRTIKAITKTENENEILIYYRKELEIGLLVLNETKIYNIISHEEMDLPIVSNCTTSLLKDNKIICINNNKLERYDLSGNLESSVMIPINEIRDMLENLEDASLDGKIRLTSIFENQNGEIVIGGYVARISDYSYGRSLSYIDEEELKTENFNSCKGFLLTTEMSKDIEEIKELQVVNNRKEFKIRTEVKKIDGNKGGEITGENNNPYEVVKYGDPSELPIRMTPLDENYEIIAITVNGIDWPFKAKDDGSYDMPQFDSVTENKHVVVTFAKKSNKITINKVDEEGEILQGAKFAIKEVDIRPELDKNKIKGSLTESSNIESGLILTKENDVEIGDITKYSDQDTYYFEKNEDGSYSSNKVANSETTSSYIPIKLNDTNKKYVIKTNATISSEEGYDEGFATITDSIIKPSEYTLINEISGESTENYTSEILEGGKTYYLHLAYSKDSSYSEGEDKLIINSINVYSTNGDVYTYKFEEVEPGKYMSNNQGYNNSTAKSCIPIDLTGYYGKYNLIVNAEISSKENDCGYAAITTDMITPLPYESEKEFINISGKQSAKNYTIVLDGDQKYYLHLGYSKSNEGIALGSILYNMRNADVEDTFTINSIEVTPNGDHLYYTETESNSEGQAITQIPYGKYEIKEVKAPEGYWLNEEPQIVEFTESGEHEFTIANTKKEKVTVHHYKIDRDGNKTEEKVAEDDIIEQQLDEKGKPEERYSSQPHLDLQKYELQKDSEGNYIIPVNATGRYDENDEVFYYYVEKQIPITVHHYIEGTLTPVPLAEGVTFEELVQDGYTYEDNFYKSSGYEGESYTTSAIPNDKLSADYELVKMPDSYEGQFNGDEIIVNYYYKKVRRNVNLVKYAEDGVTLLEGAKFTIYGKEYVTNSNGRISVELESGEHEIIEIEAPEGYQLPENPTTNITITRDTTEENVSVINKRKQGKVIVYHYIEDTEDFVPLNDGTTAVPDEREQTIGEMYATKPLENVAENYEYISCEGETSGIYEEGTKVVKYYYTETKISGAKSWTTNVNRIMLNADGETVKYVQEGDIITYTITARNDGKHDKEIVIKDDVPDGTTFVGNVKINGVADNTKTENNLKEGITVNVPAGREVTLSFDVSVNPLVEGIFEREIRNIAVVNGKNTEPEVVIPVKKPNVVVSKLSNPATTEENKTKVKVGDEITYSIELNNSIGTAPTKVRVKDGAPVGTTFKTGSITLNSVNTDGTVIEETSIDLSEKTEADLRDTGIDVDLEAGEIKVLSFVVTVVDTNDGKSTDLSNNTTITNIAQVSKNPEDTNPTYEDTNEVTHVYVEPIITAEKTWKAEQERTYTNKEGKKIQYVLEGDTIEYTITATNEGGLGKDIKVVDILQPGMTFVEGSIKVNGRDTAYTLDDLQATGITVNVPAKVGDTNGTATVGFKVTVDELGEDVSGNQIYFGQLKNKATVDGKDTTEVITNVNKSNIIFGKTVNIAGKEANGQEVRIGDELTYNISVSNTGSLPDIVTISDSVPTNTEYVDDSVSVKVGDTIYTADEIETGVEGISIAKTGDVVTGILVEDMELYPGEDIIVSFKVKVTGEAKDGDIITNIATVNGKETEPVINPVVRPIIAVQKEIAEVTHMNVDKEIDELIGRQDYAFRGDKITYNIKATNTGSAEGTIVIKDIISDKVNLDVDSIRVGGTAIRGMTAEKFASEGIEVTVPAKTADGNGEVILSFTVKVKGDASVIDETGVVGDVTNKATWKYEKPIEDPNPSNPEQPEVPTEHETEEVKVPIVVIEKKADIIRTTEENQTTVPEGTVTANDKITYTIAVTNTGTSEAGKFIVTDDIPEGTTILNSNGGTINDKTISWTIESLPAKQEGKEDNKAEISFTVTVDYDAVASKNIVNVAYVNDKPTNETETPYEKPTPKMTTSITKTGDKITMIGNQIYYKITYTATIEDFVGKANIVIEDQLPYEIIESKSNLEYASTDGTVNDEVIKASKNLKLMEVEGKTIKWEMTEGNIDTYKTGKPHEIELVKEMLLYYDTTTLPESIDNTAVSTTQLREPDLDNPESDKDVGAPDIAKSSHTVTVKTAYKLPETGRNGTTIFAIIGLIIVGVAVTMCYKVKHKDI